MAGLADLFSLLSIGLGTGAGGGGGGVGYPLYGTNTSGQFNGRTSPVQTPSGFVNLPVRSQGGGRWTENRPLNYYGALNAGDSAGVFLNGGWDIGPNTNVFPNFAKAQAAADQAYFDATTPFQLRDLMSINRPQAGIQQQGQWYNRNGNVGNPYPLGRSPFHDPGLFPNFTPQQLGVFAKDQSIWPRGFGLGPMLNSNIPIFGSRGLPGLNWAQFV